MERVFLIIGMIVLFTIHTKAQDILSKDVPSLIINKFQQDYPKAKDISWEKKGVNYEVDFDLGFPERDHEILYAPTSEVLRHKQEIKVKDLPANVKEKVLVEFPNYQIKDVNKIIMGTATFYTLEVKSSSVKWELKVDDKGNIINKKQD